MVINEPQIDFLGVDNIKVFSQYPRLSNSRPHCRMGARAVLQDFLLYGVHLKQRYMIDKKFHGSADQNCPIERLFGCATS